MCFDPLEAEVSFPYLPKEQFYTRRLLIIAETDRLKMTESLEEKVMKALEEIKPRIQADGGDIDLVAVEKNIAKVRLRGACAGCPMSALTLKQGVEKLIKSKVPEIEKVEAVQ